MAEAADTKTDPKDKPKSQPDKAADKTATKPDHPDHIDHTDHSHDSTDTAAPLIDKVHNEVSKADAAAIAAANAERTRAAAARLLTSMDVTTESGAHLTLDSQGRVTRQETARAALELKYNDDGKPAKVTLKDKDGEWTSEDGKTFIRDGKVKTLAKGADETLDFKDAAPATAMAPGNRRRAANSQCGNCSAPQAAAVLPDASQKREVADPTAGVTDASQRRDVSTPVAARQLWCQTRTVPPKAFFSVSKLSVPICKSSPRFRIRRAAAASISALESLSCWGFGKLGGLGQFLARGGRAASARLWPSACSFSMGSGPDPGLCTFQIARGGSGFRFNFGEFVR